ncbi:MAG TPA: RNA polymerase sigma factor [Anaerolineales bacterium]
METDKVLLQAAQKMDKDAIVEIFELYNSPLYNYVLRLSGDRILADHIVGDVFAKLIEQLSLGKGPESNLRSYLYETAYHRLIDETRFTRRRAPLEAAAWIPQDRNSLFVSVEDEILFKQVLHIIRNRLTEDQRHVIVLRYLEEFSLRETATILGKRVEHVKVIQGRAIVALRKTLDYQNMRKLFSSPLVRNFTQSIGI